VQRILAELEEAGIVRRERRGRRNHYEIEDDAPLRHPLEAHRTVGDLLRMLKKKT
jgi:DNA-binding transcriptional ArsR family regulator